MNNETPQIIISETPKTPDQIAKEIIGDRETQTKLLTTVKEQIDYQKRKEGGRFSPEKLTDKISGFMRGSLAEEIIARISLGQCETIDYDMYPEDNKTTELKIATPQNITGIQEKNKGNFLTKLIQEDLEQNPISIPKDLHITQKTVSEINTEIAEGYGYGGKFPGIFYAESSLPDGLLVSGEEVVGVLEVKAYTIEEFGHMINQTYETSNLTVTDTAKNFGHSYPEAQNDTLTLGVRLQEEMHFMDILRAHRFGQEPLNEGGLFVMLVPNNIPGNLLIRYRDILDAYGYKIEIRKLPLSTDEIDELSKKIIRDYEPEDSKQLLSQNNNPFSAKDTRVILDWAKS